MKNNFDLARNEILNIDGTCRDINFDEELDWKNIIKLVDYFSENWKFNEVFTSNGIQIKPHNIKNLANKDSIISSCSNGKFITKIQLFISREKTNKGFIEITFNPEDVNLGADATVLENFLNDLKKIANSETLFLRYENASWKYGDDESPYVILYYDTKS